MKKIILSILCLFFIIAASAQQKGSYIYVGGGVGASGFQYNVADGKDQLGLGFLGNMGYSYFFHKNWGLGTGIQVSRYAASGIFTDHLISFEGRVDEVGDVHRKDIYLKNWDEEQKALFFEIPLIFQYQYKDKLQRHGFYGNMGVKVQLPLSSTYEVTGGEVREGYYDQWHVLLYDLPQHGFGEYDKKMSGNLDFKTSVAGTVEFGYLYGISPFVDFYMGAFCDYGFTTLNTNRDENKDVIYIDSYDQEAYQSILKSKSSDNANALFFGTKLGFRFRPVSKPKQLVADSETPIVPVTPESKPIDTVLVIPQPEPEIVVIIQPELVKDTKHPEPSKEEMDFMLKPIAQYLNSVSSIPPAEKAQLDKNIEILKKYPHLDVTLEGHTCDLGSDEFNMKLGLQRAEKVKAYMINSGISASRLTVVSKGETEHVVPNIDEAHRKQNRRVEFLPANQGKSASAGDSKTQSAKQEKKDIVIVQPVLEPTDATANNQQPTQEELNLLLRPIINYTNSVAAIPAKQKAQLDQNIAIMKKYPHLNIILEGHTCDLGASDFNLKLGTQRALRIKTYMVVNGISPLRLKIATKGETEPAVPNTNETNRKRNRRVEFLRGEDSK